MGGRWTLKPVSKTMRPALVGLALLLWVVVVAPAEVERLEVVERLAVADGQPFGLAGPFEKLAGRVHFALDPAAPSNGRITDLDKAPRDADGKVRFAADFYLIRPVAARGNGAVLIEVPNRGGKAITRYFQRGAARRLDPVDTEAHGDGFLLRQGFSLAWIGWQFDLPEGEGLLGLDAVWAGPAEGPETIVGLVRSDHVFAEEARVMPLAHRGHRPYPAADVDDLTARLTVRESRFGPRKILNRDDWRFARLEEGADGERIVADAGFVYLSTGFEKGKIYEVVYRSRRPAVVGLGLAAVRDFTSYLKHSPKSPLQVDRALGMGISQTGRFLRHFLYQGFNTDLAGRRAFDGLLVHSAGAGRGSFNHRFAQPSRDAHPYSSFLYPTDLFPFTGRAQLEPASGREEGILSRALKDGVAPKIFFTNSGYEYWGRGASLIHTSVDGGRDVAPLANERIYHFASTQHFVDRFPPARRGTVHPANPADFLWNLRALLVALDRWVATGAEPPASRYPRLADGSLVAPENYNFPAIPGLRTDPRPYPVHRLDFGDRFLSEGIVDRQPPRFGAEYPVRVPAVDADGNERGGVRLPEIEVPVATYTAWNWRSPEIGAGDQLADFRGACLPLPRTQAQGEASGDPRRALAQRYSSREEYLGRYAEAARRLIAEGFLLAEDLAPLLDRASELWQWANPAVQQSENRATASLKEASNR